MTEGAPTLLEMRLFAARAIAREAAAVARPERRAYEVPACGKARRAGGQRRPRLGSHGGRRAMTEITLTDGDARATIALLGAEARTWRIAGRDLLWPGDAAIWSDISPILYPVVGWTRDGARVEGMQFALGLP